MSQYPQNSINQIALKKSECSLLLPMAPTVLYHKANLESFNCAWRVCKELWQRWEILLRIWKKNKRISMRRWVLNDYLWKYLLDKMRVVLLINVLIWFRIWVDDNNITYPNVKPSFGHVRKGASQRFRHSRTSLRLDQELT